MGFRSSYEGCESVSREPKGRTMYGQLIPVGGGDPIPLLSKSLLVGRRESCDVVLRFANVSAHHCRLNVHHGYWFLADENSRNGTRVNGIRVRYKRLDPGDVLSVAGHKYEVRYSPAENGSCGPPPPEETEEDIFGQSLLQRAGLEKPRNARDEPRR